jgi:Ribosomal protein L11 methyltransferase (PrmA)
MEHARMLHDHRRTGDYLAALTAAVRPGDVVLDIGTGSGVLSVAAARAGARRVYAVEATDIASVAERVFEVYGVQDRVSLLSGWSRQIELPEKADLLVAEIIGNEPFEEEILETTLDARQRLLKPGARLIPHALTLLARPVQPPSSAGEICTASTSSRSSTPHCRDRSTPSPRARSSRRGRRWAPRSCWARWTWPLSRSLRCARPRSHGRSSGPSQLRRDDVPRRPARWDLAHLDPWTWPASSWATSVWVLRDPVDIGPGCALRVVYNRRVAGTPDGLTCEGVERSRT